MQFVQLRESDIQKDLEKMESEMAHLSSRLDLSSEIGMVRQKAHSQLAKSRLLSSELQTSLRQPR